MVFLLFFTLVSSFFFFLIKGATNNSCTDVSKLAQFNNTVRQLKPGYLLFYTVPP